MRNIRPLVRLWHSIYQLESQLFGYMSREGTFHMQTKRDSSVVISYLPKSHIYTGLNYELQTLKLSIFTAIFRLLPLS